MTRVLKLNLIPRQFFISCVLAIFLLSVYLPIYATTPSFQLSKIKLENKTVSYNGISKELLSKLLIAEMALSNQDFKTAYRTYWTLAQSKKSAIFAQRSVFIAQYIDKNKMLEAAKFWAKLAPKDIEAQKISAGLLLETKQYLPAIPYLENLAILQKNSNFLLIIKALLKDQAEKLPEVLPVLTRLEHKIGLNIDLATSYALVYYYTQNLEKSEFYLDKALKIDQNFLSAILLKAQILSKQGKTAKAEKFLLAAQKRNPSQLRIYLNLVKLQFQAGKKTLAKETFNKMLKNADKDAETSLILADYLFSLNMYEEAKFVALELLKLNKYQDRTNLLLAKITSAQIREDKTKIDLAFSYLSKVKNTPAGFIEASYFGVLLASKYQNGKAALNWAFQNLEFAFENMPEDLLDYLLTIYKGMQAGELADKYLKTWLDEAILLCADNDLDDSELIYARAFYWYKLKNIAQMEKDLRSLVEKETTEPSYLNALAYVLVDEDKNLAQSEKISRYREGLEFAEQAAQLEQSLSVLDTFGWALYKNGKFKKAEQTLQQAKQIEPENEEVNTHLIQVYWAMGKSTKAKSLVQHMLNSNRDLPRLKTLLNAKPYLKP